MTFSEKRQKIEDIKKNIRDAILVCLFIYQNITFIILLYWFNSLIFV